MYKNGCLFIGLIGLACYAYGLTQPMNSPVPSSSPIVKKKVSHPATTAKQPKSETSPLPNSVSSAKKSSSPSFSDAEKIWKNTSVTGHLDVGYMALLNQDRSGKNHHESFVGNENRESMVDVRTHAMANAGTVEAGAHLQLGLLINPSSTVMQNSHHDESSLYARTAEAYITTEATVFSVGRGPMATYGLLRNTDSDADEVANVDAYRVGGEYQFSSIGPVETLPTISNLYGVVDGVLRSDTKQPNDYSPKQDTQMRARVDKDFAHGLSVSMAAANQSQDAKLSYQQEFMHNTKFKAAFGVATPQYWLAINPNPSETAYTSIGGMVYDASTALRWSNGVGLALAYEQVDNHHNKSFHGKPSTSYAALSYAKHFTSLGLTTLGIDYGQYHDYFIEQNTATKYGLQLAQRLKELHTTVYAGYNIYAPHQPHNQIGLNHIRAFLVGLAYDF